MGKVNLSKLERFCVSLIKHPTRHLLGYISFILIIALTVLALDVFQLSELGEYDWAVPAGKASVAEDAVRSALLAVDPVDNGTEVVTSRSKGSTKGVFQIIYDSIGDNKEVFTPQRLKLMCEFEQLITKNKSYPKFCITSKPDGDNTACLLPLTSVVVSFYQVVDKQFDYSDCPLLPDTVVETIRNKIYKDIETEVGQSQVGFFVDIDTLETKKSKSTRSVIQLGAPLDGFSGELDRSAKQEELYQEFISDFETLFFKAYGLETVLLRSAYRTDVIVGDADNQIQIRMFSEQLFNKELSEQVAGDLILVVGSLLFVTLWMYMHTDAWFITLVSMFVIVASLIVAFFMYRFVFQVTYFTELHILTIFLILGIGADDVFVFVDSWKQNRFAKHPAKLAASGRYADAASEFDEKHPSKGNTEFLIARLYATYKHSASSVFNTSFTTATAFFATAISPIMPVSSFGIYAANCIVINYLYVLTVIPATVIIHHYYMENFSSCDVLRCKTCKPEDSDDLRIRSIEMDDEERDDKPASILNLNEKERLEDEANATGSYVERAFEHAYLPAMLYSITIPGTKYVIRPFALTVVVLCVAYTAVSTYWALNLESPVKFDENFSKNHMFTGFFDDFSLGFLGGADTQFERGTVTWGIKDIDRSNFDRYVPGENRGVAVYDDNFDLTRPETQQLLLHICETVVDVGCDEVGCTGGDKLVLPSSMRCFIQEFVDWLKEPENGEYDSLELGETDPDLFYAKLKEFRETTVPEQRQREKWEDLIGFVDGELKFVTIKFTMTLPLLQPSGVVEPVEKIYVDFLENAVSSFISDNKVDDEVTKGLTMYQYLIGARTRWNETQYFLVQGMLNGFAICFPVAFLVLLFATDNVILAFYAIISIASIVGCVLGFVQHFMGWYLGISEALVAVMIVGFSVDYVVHLGHTFMEAGGPAVGLQKREERFIFAANNMGPTVLAGAITTGGAGLFMFGCQLVFFAKMAVLISVTVLFSSIMAHGLFMGLCLMVGPQGSTGKLSKYLCKKTADSVSEDESLSHERPQLLDNVQA